MRKVLTTALVGVLATLVLTTGSALAVQVTASVDHRIVSAGGSMTITGTITDDNGTAGNFDYRIAAVAPGKEDGGDRIIVCDSGKQSTNGAKNVSFTCNIPTIENLTALGVENAADRFVIPIKGGIAVTDPATNESKKTHGAAALIVNTGKVQQRLEDALTRIDAFINRSQDLSARCDNITAKAEEAGAQNVVEKCADFQEKLQEQVSKAALAEGNISQILANLNSSTAPSYDSLKDALKGFGDGAMGLKINTDQFKAFFDTARADLEKRASESIVNSTRQRAEDLREKLLQQRSEIDQKLADIDTRLLKGNLTAIQRAREILSESNSSEQAKEAIAALINGERPLPPKPAPEPQKSGEGSGSTGETSGSNSGESVRSNSSGSGG